MNFSGAQRVINIKNIKEILDKQGNQIDLENYSYGELSELLTYAETIACGCRKQMMVSEDKNNKVLIHDSNDNILITSELEIINEAKTKATDTSTYDVTCEFVDGILKIHTPLTFKRNMYKEHITDNYLLTNYIDIAITNCLNNTQNLPEKLLENKIICVLERVAKDFDINTICDNDNLENSRIINTIVRRFGSNDDAETMDLYLKFRKDFNENNHGMNLYFINKNNKEKLFELIYK